MLLDQKHKNGNVPFLANLSKAQLLNEGGNLEQHNVFTNDSVTTLGNDF